MFQKRDREIMKKLLYLTFLPAILWMVFIFGFSKDTGDASSSLSLTITSKIVDIIEYNKDITEYEYNNLVEMLHTPVRKAAHMTEYAILAILICIPLIINTNVQNIKIRDYGQIFLIAFIICIIYAVTDEIHQLFVPGRTGKITDVLIDSVGALCGVLVFLGIHKLTYAKIVRKSKK